MTQLRFYADDWQAVYTPNGTDDDTPHRRRVTPVACPLSWVT